MTPIPHGVHRYNSNTTYVGSEVSFSCSQAHRLNGVVKRICLESGVWSDSSPRCEGKYNHIVSVMRRFHP